nr:hypothetical protein [uncultured Campylobacter sp.]
MLAKLELSIEKPDVLAKVKEFLKSLGNDIKVKEENITNKKLEAFNGVCGSVKLNIPVEPEELEEARAKKYVL